MNLIPSHTSKDSNNMISCQNSQISTREDCQIKISDQLDEEDIYPLNDLETEVKEKYLRKQQKQKLDLAILSVDEPSLSMKDLKSCLSHDSKNLETSESKVLFPNNVNSARRISSPSMSSKKNVFNTVY